jgi:hypothetical protein
MFQTDVVGKIQTHFMFSNFYQKSWRLWDNTENMSAIQASDDTLIDAYALHSEYLGYRHILR